jgi:hypothetical protein
MLKLGEGWVAGWGLIFLGSGWLILGGADWLVGGTEWLASGSDDSETVVLKVSEAVSAPLNELHLSMEALGEAVVFGEAPRGGDLTPPILECLCEDLHRSMPPRPVLFDVRKQFEDQVFGPCFCLVFYIELAAEVVCPPRGQT